METWRDIPGYEGFYQASDLGNIKSLNYNKTGCVKILRTKSNGTGYIQVELKGKLYYVHRLVVFAFKGVLPLPVDHIDHDRTNNALINLRYTTTRDNLHGRKRKRVLPIGVSRNGKRKKFRSVITINGKRKHIGYFETPELASEAFKNELKKING